MKEYLTFNIYSHFNIVNADDEQSAEILTNGICLGETKEHDHLVIKRIRELLEN